MTIDLRTITYDVPPQEVMVTSLSLLRLIFTPLFPFTVYPFTSSNEINLFHLTFEKFSKWYKVIHYHKDAIR